GLVNAALVGRLRINSFIATLASSIVFRGIAILVTGGLIVTVTDPAFAVLGTATFLAAKYTVWVYLAVIAATWFVLERTVLGRYFFAVGGNPEAARLSGIPVERVRVAAFVISGMCAGMAGVLAASRTSSAQPDLGIGLELSAIAAAVVGGTSILGGEGAIWRAVLGVLILALIGNGFNLLGIDTIYQQIVQGVLIVVAVGADQLLGRRR
nr:ABC transporter permease [Chloroflexia bacterium]